MILPGTAAARRGLPDPPILVITDRRQAALPLPDLAAELFAGGIRWLSLREKDLAPADRLDLLVRLRAGADRYGATLMVHDDLPAAAALGLGLHLPDRPDPDPAAVRARLAPSVLLGRSGHPPAPLPDDDALDYLTVSPIRLSASKPGHGPALGLAGLAAAVRATPLPVLALGGLTAADLAGCRAAGAAGMAVMGAMMTAPRPAEAAAALIAAFNAAPLYPAGDRPG